MNTLGLIGGMSWESTAVYYRLLNEAVKTRLGGLHSCPLLLHSVDFAPVAQAQARGDWHALALQLAQVARGLQAAGAQAIVLCTNTMHRVAPAVQAAVPLPLLHIGDAVVAGARRAGVQRPALLATRFTMEQAFMRERLAAGGLDVRVPDEAGRTRVHRIIYEELCQGRVSEASRHVLLDEIALLRAAGADSVLLGCTELCLILDQADLDLPLLDSTALHVAQAVDFAREETPVLPVPGIGPVDAVDEAFAPLAPTPYCAVIFSSRRTPIDEGYAEMAALMSRMAADQPGYLGSEHARGADGFGITVSYWESEVHAQAWKRVSQHLGAQRLGRERWYSRFVTRVTTVQRGYAGGG